MPSCRNVLEQSVCVRVCACTHVCVRVRVCVTKSCGFEDPTPTESHCFCLWHGRQLIEPEVVQLLTFPPEHAVRVLDEGLVDESIE